MLFVENNLRFQTIFPISLIMAIILIVLVITIPRLVQTNAEQSSFETAVNSLKQFKVLRAYYTDNVVKKVQKTRVLMPSMDHYNQPDKIPLPVTMIHDLSELFEKNGSKLSLYSAYPYPNRQHRELDAFQQQAWNDFQKQPDKVIKKITSTDGRVVLRVAMSDQMQVQACVDCHNSHPLSPKNDWQVGDVRGVLEIAIDITSQLELASTLSFLIITGMVIGCIVLIIIFFYFTRRITDQFSDISNCMIRLGNGDYSTEFSQASSTLEINQLQGAFTLFKESLIERQKLEQQKQLYETEKITSLGSMVAGVAHEVNTPLGIGITAATFLQDELALLEKKLLSEEFKKTDLEDFLIYCNNSISMLCRNLNRAAELIRSFKQVSVDQVSEEAREIVLSQYFQEIIHSLHPKIKKAAVTVNLDCKDDSYCITYPGALAQVVSNLVENSILHGFGERKGGIINICLSVHNEEIVMVYTDDGEGIADDILSKVMIPFFTTKRDDGGSGLGLSIIHNIVTQKLQGKIELTSAQGEGVTFNISFPTLPAEENGNSSDK